MAPPASTPAARRRSACTPLRASNRSTSSRSRCPCKACRSSTDIVSAGASYIAPIIAEKCSRREDALHELLELAGVAALDHRDDLAVVGGSRVAGPPVLPR